MKNKDGLGKGKTTVCNDCDPCKIPGGHPGDLQIALLQGVAGKVKNREAIVTIFHTYTEISTLSFGPIYLLDNRNRYCMNDRKESVHWTR